MLSVRVAVVMGVAALFSARFTTCRSPGEGGAEPSPQKAQREDVTLPAVDTSALTTREKSEWSGYVSEFLTPCSDQPVSLAQCVKESRACKACAPAARYLVDLARRGQVRSQVEAAYKARFSPDAVQKIDITGSPAKGPVNAKVVLVEFADFQCPACGAARPRIDEILSHYPNDVRLVFKHFPLTVHENAEKASRAAVAALHQNKFWEMDAVLFEKQQQLDPASVENLAKGLGLDMKRFVQDRDSEATADAVARDRKQGEALAIRSTPSFFINGRPFPPGNDLGDDLDQWIKLEIELTGATPPVPPPASPAPAKPEPAKPEPAKPGASTNRAPSAAPKAAANTPVP